MLCLGGVKAKPIRRKNMERGKHHSESIYLLISRFFLISGVVFSILVLNADISPAGESRWNVNGFIKNASGYIISEDNHDLLKCENILQIEPEFSFQDTIKFFGVFRGYYDAVFDLNKSGWTEDFRYKDEIRNNNAYTLSDPVRELYAETRWNKFFMRLGKQQVAWGKAIGMKMLDVINPQDMRELNQLDFEESRISLWTANLIYNTPLRGSSLQLLLIPDIEPHYLPPAGHPFSDRSINSMQQLVDQGIIRLRESPTEGVNVSKDLSNMEIGVKWYHNLVDFEYSLNYFHHWSDLAGLYFDSFGSDGVPDYNMEYHRFHTLGGSFTNYFHNFFGLGDTILRGEVAAHINDRVYSMDPTVPVLGLGMAESDSFNYMIAFDIWPFTNYYASFQFFQFICLDHQDNYLVDEIDNSLSFFITTDYMEERVFPDFLWFYTDDGDHWLRGRCRLKYTDKLSFTIGANFYFGGSDTFLGQYDDNDNLFVEIKCDF